MLKVKTLSENYLRDNFWLAQSTQDTNKRAVRYLCEAVGNQLLTHLQYKHFERYKGWLVRTSRAKNTANMYLRSVHSMLNWAILQRFLTENPMAGLKQFKVTRKPVRIYEDWQIERMVRYALNPRWRALIICARATGLRRGELLNLNKDNIRQGYIYVEPKRNTKKTWEWEAKDKELRRVPLPQALQKMIDRLECYYLFLTAKRYRDLLSLKNTFGTLSEDVRRCPEQNFRRTFVAIQRRAFGRQIGDFHSLRKTYTTCMCEVLPDHFVMKLTGHNSLKTLTYYQGSRESYYEIAREAALGGTKNGMSGLQSMAQREACCDIPNGRYGT